MAHLQGCSWVCVICIPGTLIFARVPTASCVGTPVEELLCRGRWILSITSYLIWVQVEGRPSHQGPAAEKLRASKMYLSLPSLLEPNLSFRDLTDSLERWFNNLTKNSSKITATWQRDRRKVEVEMNDKPRNEVCIFHYQVIALRYFSRCDRIHFFLCSSEMK